MSQKISLAEGRALYEAGRALPPVPGLDGLTDEWRAAHDEWAAKVNAWERWRNENAAALLELAEAAVAWGDRYDRSIILPKVHESDVNLRAAIAKFTEAP